MSDGATDKVSVQNVKGERGAEGQKAGLIKIHRHDKLFVSASHALGK